MTPHLPLEDPSDRSSLVDRTAAYVRSSRLLRLLLIVTVLDHVAAIVLVLLGGISGFVAGLFALFSVLTWFFGVLVPVMNREVRLRFGVEAASYWGDVTEMFANVVLCLTTGMYTAMVVQVSVQRFL